MKNLKKLISVIIAVIMLVSSFATVSAADYADVESTNSYYKAIKVLSGLGIAKGDGTNFNPTNDVKRSEMVAFVCRMMGEEDIATASASNAFTDVADGHWAAGYIAWGVNRGIINGMGDGTFAPDASVKYQDAVVMIMRALGYDRIAQRAENGGYPTGYLKLASQYGVLKDAGYDNAKAATREIIAQLIYNGLTAPLVDVSYYGVSVEDDRYVIYNGKGGYDLRTLLSYANDIVKVKATIDETPKADPDTCIDKAGNYLVKITVVDGYDYKEAAAKELFGVDGSGNIINTGYVYVGATEAADLLGSTVEAYLAEDEDLNDWKLLAIVADAKTVVEETLTENLNTIVVTSGKVSYYADLQDRKLTEIEVATTGLKVYYNGVEATSDIDTVFAEGSDDPATAYDDTNGLAILLAEKADSITFMGAKNAAYDKIFVTDYTYAVVKSVNADEKLIKLEVGALDLSVEGRNNNEKFMYSIYDANGKAMDIADITEGDVLNIVCPLDGTTVGNIHDVDYLDIYVTNETVTGVVGEKKTSGKYVIDGEEYATANSVSLTLGEEGTFFLSIDGKIVKKDAATSISKNFALYIGSDYEEAFGNKKFEVKLFTAEGEKNLKVADTLKVYAADGTYTTKKAKDGDQDAVIAALDANRADQATKADAEAKAKASFITYAVDANGEIKEIRYAGGESSELVAAYDRASASYDAEFEEFGGMEIGDAKLFVAPVVETVVTECDGGDGCDHESCAYDSTWNVDTDKLGFGTFASLDEKKTFNSYLYTVNGDDVLSAVLTTDEMSYGLEKSPLAVIAAIGEQLDADDNTVKSYTIVQSGEVKTIVADYDEYGSSGLGYAVGDIFQYAVDAEDEIAEAKLVYDAANRALTTYAKNFSVAEDEMAFVFGVVTEYADYIVLATDVDANLKATASAKFKVAEAEGATYAWIEEAAANNPVKKITINGVRETVRANAVYAAVAKVNDKSRVEDIIVIALTNNEVGTPCDGGDGCDHSSCALDYIFDEVADINAFTNWEIDATNDIDA